MALFALKISSTNAMSASGSLSVVTRVNWSCSRALRLMGPNSSSGVDYVQPVVMASSPMPWAKFPRHRGGLLIRSHS
jgi:hypothetical protein